MAWYRRRWSESRGDAFSAWGAATYYFLADERGMVQIQIEIYDDGHVLRYDTTHPDDEFGSLAVQSLELSEFAAFEIEEASVQHALRLQPSNR